MKAQHAVLFALAAVACSGDDPSPLALLGCPWTRKSDVQLADAPDGTCWRVVAPAGMAVTMPGAGACAAAQSERVTIWPPRQLLTLWVEWSSSGELQVNPAPVSCP